jgi:type III secretion protein L
MTDKFIKPDTLADKMVASSLSSPKVLKREVYEATREARDVVAQAQEQAKRILEEAERKRDSILDEARQEGYRQGLVEWNQILVKTLRVAEDLKKSWEDTLLRLSVRMAEKIIGEHLKFYPDTIIGIIRQALEGSRFGRQLTIRVSEAEAGEVRRQVQRLKESLGFSSDIEIVPSANLSPGDCVIESELGIVDARLETQLKCLEDALTRGVATDQ